MDQVVRIIGGLYRGKKLHFPATAGLRPTPARVRETLFNWLMHSIRGAHCLDAFAGSGALGFEAFSRGAAHVTLLETSRPVFTQLSRVAQQFASTALSVKHTDALLFLAQQKTSFDIIFFDPPFALLPSLPAECFSQLAGCLKPQGLLYLESPHPIALDPLIWRVLKSKQAGQVHYALYQKTN
jgi:16S rRNA (guanine966-N2)-methyltransferase